MSVTKLEKQFGGETLFSDVSFTLEDGHKAALVGKNGAGKSTLMKIVAGTETANAGTVTLAKGKRVAYLPQEVQSGETRTGLAYIQEGTDIPLHQCMPVLNGLGVSQEVAEQPLSAMSGGQQTKVLLTRFLLTPADILLFDEPTNNLDIPSLLWLEKFLADSKKTMIIISHDLLFLDTVTDRVFELKNGSLTIERGAYSDYLEREKKKREKQMREYLVAQEERKRLEQNVVTLQKKGEGIDAVTVKDNNKMAASRKKDSASSGQRQATVLKRRIDKMEKVEKPFEEEPLLLQVHPKNTESDIEIDVEDLVAGHTDSPHIGPFSFKLAMGERICLMGENGAGKSTVLKTISGLLPPVQGEVKKTQGVIVGDFMQHHERIQGEMNAVEFFIQEARSNKETAMHRLKQIGFQEATLNQRVDGLSSGMRARLLFAIFAVLGVNVLVLDEPTNHLDIEAVSALQEMLKQYTGIVLLVSHNRRFLEALGIERYYKIENGILERIEDFVSYVAQAQKKAEQMVGRFKRMSLK